MTGLFDLVARGVAAVRSIPWTRWAIVTLTALIVVASLRGARSRVVVHEFAYSTSLEAPTSAAPALARTFSAALVTVTQEADTRIRRPRFRELPKPPDIEIPGATLRVSQVLDYVTATLGWIPFTVDGHVVKHGESYCLLLTMSGGMLDEPIVRELACRPELDDLLRAGAREALKVVSPVSLAGYCRHHETECEPVDALLYAVTHPPEADDVWAYNLWGAILANRQDLAAADLMLREAQRLDPGFPLAHFNLAYVLNALGRTSDARLEYERAAYGPDPFVRAIASTNLGLMALAHEDLDLAERQFARAIAADPSTRTAYSSWGNVLLARGRYDAAIAMYAKAYTLDPHDPLPVMNWGIALDQAGRFEEARRRYVSAAAIEPSNPMPYYLLAEWQQTHGTREETVAALRSFLARASPNHPKRGAAEAQIRTLSGDMP